MKWRVKDYADGWILYETQEEAWASEEAQNGARVERWSDEKQSWRPSGPPNPVRKKGPRMPTRFKTHKPGRGGWSEWVCPNPSVNYLMKCCDCGLVHEMQFKAFAEANRKRGAFTVIELPWPIRAMFRARRSRVKPSN